MSKQSIQLFGHQKLPDKSIMATPLVCYTLIRGGIRKSVVFSSNAALFKVLRHHYILYPYKAGGGFVTCY
jgi:hypothetical protein